MAKRDGAQVAPLAPQVLTATPEERGTAGDQASQIAVIQARVLMAKQWRRSEEEAWARLVKAAKRWSFADRATYSYPRGTTTITGPSVYLAREAARVWGNIHHAVRIVREDEKTRVIEAVVWDLESNTIVSAQDEFAKLIQRKVEDPETHTWQTLWVEPDERNLRELHNRRAAILVRNCILQLMPTDFIEDALDQAAKTLCNEAAKDPDAAAKRTIETFTEVSITAEMLAEYLGHEVGKCSPTEIQDLRGIFRSIRDGNSTWEETMAAKKGTGTDGEEMDQMELDIASLLLWQRQNHSKVLMPGGTLRVALEAASIDEIKKQIGTLVPEEPEAQPEQKAAKPAKAAVSKSAPAATTAKPVAAKPAQKEQAKAPAKGAAPKAATAAPPEQSPAPAPQVETPGEATEAKIADASAAPATIPVQEEEPAEDGLNAFQRAGVTTDELWGKARKIGGIFRADLYGKSLEVKGDKAKTDAWLEEIKAGTIDRPQAKKPAAPSG